MSANPVSDHIWTEPQLLQVQHLTRYSYNGMVCDSFNEARLHPVDDHGQLCKEFNLRIEPTAILREYPDFYGNHVHYFDVTPLHDSLEVEANSIVQTHADDRGDVLQGISPSTLQDSTVREECFSFLGTSDFVSLGAAIWREALDALPGGVHDLWPDSVTLGKHVYTHFKYSPRSTTVNTHPEEVVRSREGVCQDFAHVMIGMCRSQGIPARYVSGYFFNPNRLPDEIEASHAWVEIYIPGYGWKGYDPTHDRPADTRYVKLAVGRDYADIRPVGGNYRGKGTQKLSVEVRVQRAATAS